MKSNEFKLITSDGVQIHVYEWLPDLSDEIKAVVQIAHGMAEHAVRYENFARFLTDNQIAVYANDHRGHGKTAGELEKVGIIPKSKGWDYMVSDLSLLGHHIRKQYKSIPVFLLGHSMGSFLVRKFILAPDIVLKGAIISGTGDDPGILGKVGVVLTQLLIIVYGSDSLSPFMDNLSFGAFNKPFAPNRTKFDWLSRDNEQVDKYVSDPYCGGVFSLGFFNQMLKGLLYVSQQENINNSSKNLPILVFSGENDPVGNHGTGVKAIYHKFKKAGIKNLTLKLFPEGRHEMLNEINRDEVYQLILDWIAVTIKD